LWIHTKQVPFYFSPFSLLYPTPLIFLLCKPPWEGSFPSFPLPLLSASSEAFSPISPPSHRCSLQLFRPLEISHKLQTPIQPPMRSIFLFSLVLQLSISTTLSQFIFSGDFPSIRVFYQICLGFWFEIFESRSTILSYLQGNTRQPTSFSVVFRLLPCHLRLQRPSTYRRMFYKRQQVDLTCWCVWTTSRLFLCNSWFSMVEHLLLAISAVFLAYMPQTIRPAIQQLLMFCFCVVYVIVFPVLFFFLYFWVFLLHVSPHVHPYNGVWVLVTQYTSNITFTGDSGFMASVSQTFGPTSSKELPPRTFILHLNFGLSSPNYVFYFL